MSLSLTYTSLIAMIQTWVEDNNTEFTTALDNIIGLGETRLIRDLDLEIFSTTSTGTFTVGSQSITKPSGVVALKSLYYTDTNNEEVYLNRKSDDFLTFYWKNAATTGTPLYYAENTETTWRVAPTPSTGSTWTARYITRPTGLSSSTATTFLSTNAADLLFKACLIESQQYLKLDPSEGGVIGLITSEYNNLLPRAKLEFLRMQQMDYRPLASGTTPTQ